MTIHEKLSRLAIENHAEIEAWFKEQNETHQPLVYSSVDIRDSGHKVAPVDTNVFPAGFNNLRKSFYEDTAKKFNSYFNRYKKSDKVLIIPENHTRNKPYLKNVDVLKLLIEKTGRRVDVRKLGELSGEVDADIILLNNDLTLGVPETLQNCAQVIIPDLKLGWYSRTKSKHFNSYEKVVNEFGDKFGIDPFFISTLFYSCGEANFINAQGLEGIAENVDKMISVLRLKYKEHGITDEPYVFIKAEQGTYGMGIMTARSGEEVYNMNRAARKKMHTIKEGLINTKVIIQEGIKTSVAHNGNPAEVMVYLVGGEVVESFLRVNSERDEFSSLNKSGVEFIHAESSSACDIIARLAALAAARE